MQGEWDTDVVREKRPSILGGEKGEGPCPPGTRQSEGNRDGRLVRNPERTLRLEASQGQNETDRNPVHLLRHPHCERGAIGEKDRAKSPVGSGLGRINAYEVVLCWDCYVVAYENRRKIRPKWPDKTIKR